MKFLTSFCYLILYMYFFLVLIFEDLLIEMFKNKRRTREFTLFDKFNC